MDPKTLNAIVHDREAALYDERFTIRYDSHIGEDVRRDLVRVMGAEPDAKRALDYCCGTGYAGIGLAAGKMAAEVHACDLSVKMLQKTEANATQAGVEIRTVLCDGESLPYADETFDLIVARGALHHLPDPIAGLREVRRTLQPGGVAIVLAEPTTSGEKQVAAVVGSLARGIEAVRRAVKRPVDEEHHQWELASMAANLHTFDATAIEQIAKAAGFEHVETSTAAWAWVLALGLNYYLAGESRFAQTNPVMRALRGAAVRGAGAFDRVIGERMVPASWRHTVQALLR